MTHIDTLEYNIDTDALTRAGILQDWQADGRTRAIFERGNLELYSYADGTVRVRFSQRETFAPHRTWAVTEPDDAFSAPAFEVRDGETIVLSLPFITVHVNRDGTLKFEKDGHTFAEDAAPAGWAAASLDASTMRVLEVYTAQKPGQVTFDGQPIEAERQNNAVRVSY